LQTTSAVPAAAALAFYILSNVIQLNPEKHGKERLDDARRLADWLTSADGQRAIGGYEMHGEQLFHPSAAAPK
jgi:ABC-type tungstate transport system permease subunit